jgi:pyruvate, water dikinase
MTSDNTILWFKDISLTDRPRVGGKGGSLGELCNAMIPVPDGYVVTTDAFSTFLDILDAKHGIRKKIAALDPDDHKTLNFACSEMRTLVEQSPLLPELKQNISDAYDALGDNIPVAVRSSATSEDSEEASFAGLQDTYLWQMGHDQLMDSVRKCWASMYNPESVAYRLKLGLPEDQLAMAVVVQTMVNSRCSGVMFTRSPTTGDKSVITIEGSWGLGSSIVSGEVTPDKFVINKITGETTSRNIAEKHIEHLPEASGGISEMPVTEERRKITSISDEELSELASVARRVEKHYGIPQDIEWAIDQEGNLLLLQSRPETVWATKDKEPVAKPTAKAFDHIFNVLGGQNSK